MAADLVLFSVEYHLCGVFLAKSYIAIFWRGVCYENGVDEDETSLIEIENAVGKLGYGGNFRIWYRMHNRSMASGLKLLNDDHSMYQAFVDCRYHRKVFIYIDYLVDEVDVVQEP